MNKRKILQEYILKAATMGTKSKAKGFFPLVDGMEDFQAIESFDLSATFLDLERPLKLTVGSFNESSSHLSIQDWRSGTRKDMAACPVFGQICFVMDYYPANKKGKIAKKPYKTIFSSNNGTEFRRFGPGGIEITDSRKKQPAIPINYQLFADSSWVLSIRFDKGFPSVNLVLEKHQLQDFAKLRDVPQGKKRRDMLIHFVRNHKRSQSNRDCEIPKHLRGGISHLWEGCSMEVFPPRSEMESLKVSKKVHQTKTELELAEL